MSSEDMSLVTSQRLQNGLGSHHHQIVYQNDEALRFNCVVALGEESAGIPKTRDLSGFINERFFAATPNFRREIYGGDRPDPRNWSEAVQATPSVDGSDEDDDDEDDDDVDEAEGKGNGGNNASNGEETMGNGKQKRHNQHYGVNVTVGEGSSTIVKESGNVASSVIVTNNNNNSVVSVAENNEGYLSQYYQQGEGSRQKDSGAENGCGFSGRREVCLFSNESGDSLRAILSDPLTGALMDDAMILPCGHSFGGGGIQHVVRMKSCYTCSQSISEDSAAPNLSLRAAVQAFRREEESQFQRSAKRKRERFDQDKAVYGDSNLMELPRGRGVQFPFTVTDRVIIKGNKRTPQRFVGREAVVTTQCLNGWYVVKTLDNAESVKLQYRSLAKLSHDPLVKPISIKMPPNWL